MIEKPIRVRTAAQPAGVLRDGRRRNRFLAERFS
jgi:hypothetical protein